LSNDPPGPDGTSAPISAEPWSTPSGDPLSAAPIYAQGAAPIPPPEGPPTAQFPPVNYAPPGHAPDFGSGYQYPPPPHGGNYSPADYAAQTPPRKSNAPLIAVVVAVALLLCGGVTTAGILVTHNLTARAKEAVKPLTEPTQPDRPDSDQPDLGLPNGGGLPTDLPTDGGRHVQVTYEVTGDGPASIIYLNKLGAAPSHVDDVKLPWRFSASMDTPVLVSVIAMRTDLSDGTITCRALVDGKEVKKASSGDNALSTAVCSYFAID
jgi:hypothetical protein